MTKQELLEILEDYPDETEIRFMSQPAWPFEYSISHATDPALMGDDEGEPFTPAGDYGLPPEDVVYLVEGSQLGYGSKRAWNN